MELQRDEYIGVSQLRRGKERSQRNGYYEQEFVIRVGSLELRVPRTRDGKFSVDIFEMYQRHGKALLSTILEMYIAGVSTMKIGRIVESLYEKSVSKSFVSSLTKQLDEEVRNFQESFLKAVHYPYIMTDVN